MKIFKTWKACLWLIIALMFDFYMYANGVNDGKQNVFVLNYIIDNTDVTKSFNFSV